MWRGRPGDERSLIQHQIQWKLNSWPHSEHKIAGLIMKLKNI